MSIGLKRLGWAAALMMGATAAQAGDGTAPSSGGWAPIWSGAYIGVHGGGAFAEDRTTKLNGALGGAHVGYNWQHGAVVFGVEADVGYGGLSHKWSRHGQYFDGVDTVTVDGNSSVNQEWNGSARGRLGYNLGPALLYLTAGLATSQIKLAADLTERVAGATVYTANFAKTFSFSGVVYGAGVDYRLTDTWIGRGEVLRTHYSQANDNIDAFTGFDITTIRAGLSYQFK